MTGISTSLIGHPVCGIVASFFLHSNCGCTILSSIFALRTILQDCLSCSPEAVYAVDPTKYQVLTAISNAMSSLFLPRHSSFPHHLFYRSNSVFCFSIFSLFPGLERIPQTFSSRWGVEYSLTICTLTRVKYKKPETSKLMWFSRIFLLPIMVVFDSCGSHHTHREIFLNKIPKYITSGLLTICICLLIKKIKSLIITDSMGLTYKMLHR